MPSGEHNQPQSGSNQGSAKKERKHWLEYGIFGFVVATTIATGCAAWYSRQQWITAHDTMVVSERAFISFGSPKRIFPAHDPTKGDFIAVDMAMQNSGNTRTRDLEFTVKCVTSTIKLAEPWGLFHQEVLEHTPDVIPPKGPVDGICGFLPERWPVPDATAREQQPARQRIDPIERGLHP